MATRSRLFKHGDSPGRAYDLLGGLHHQHILPDYKEIYQVKTKDAKGKVIKTERPKQLIANKIKSAQIVRKEKKESLHGRTVIRGTSKFWNRSKAQKDIIKLQNEVALRFMEEQTKR